eukprot:scaffold1327_cov217-Alexandrium_tamarense.AAC.3
MEAMEHKIEQMEKDCAEKKESCNSRTECKELKIKCRDMEASPEEEKHNTSYLEAVIQNQSQSWVHREVYDDVGLKTLSI